MFTRVKTTTQVYFRNVSPVLTRESTGGGVRKGRGGGRGSGIKGKGEKCNVTLRGPTCGARGRDELRAGLSRARARGPARSELRATREDGDALTRAAAALLHAS